MHCKASNLLRGVYEWFDQASGTVGGERSDYIHSTIYINRKKNKFDPLMPCACKMLCKILSDDFHFIITT